MSDYTTIKEAAERLRRVEVNAFNGDVCWISKVYDPVWGNPPGIDWNHDLRVVGIAYCQEHPADDDEVVTIEWLQSIGFAEYQNPPQPLVEKVEVIVAAETLVGLYLWIGFCDQKPYGGMLGNDCWWGHPNITRGKVRRIVEALH